MPDKVRLIIGDNLKQPSIRDIITIQSTKQNLSRKMLRIIGRSSYAKYNYSIKYGGKFGDRLIKYGKSFYNKVIKPGYSKVLKPVYNATKKL